MDRRAFLASTVGTLAASASVAQQPNLRAMILGAWSLTEASTVAGTEITSWFGRQDPVSGLLIYQNNGWMSVQISGARPSKIARADYNKLNATDKFEWLKEYYAYYGTFELDDASNIVSHQIFDALLPYERNITLKRKCYLEGDILSLLTEPREESGKTTFNRLVWKRIV
jgi:hypothetical protein